MKKLCALLGVAALVSIVPATPALAEGAEVIIQEDFCTGFIPNEDGTIGTYLLGDLHAVNTKSGNTSLVCKFEFEEGLIPKARQAYDFPCNTLFGMTTDSKMVATPDGDGTLTCKIKANSGS